MIMKGCLAPARTDPVIEWCRIHPFTLMIDKSNDRNSTEKLVILADFFEGDCTKTRLLDLPALTSRTAAGIFEAVENVITTNNIPWLNVVGFASHNCKTMIGSKESVLTKLRDKSPIVFSIGCICYLASWCVKDGVKALQFKVDDLLVDIFYFFHHSSKRISEFKAFQEFTEVDEDRILKHCPTRWLSLEKVVNRTLSHLPGLKIYFASHKGVKKTGKVTLIHDPMTSLI